MNKAIQLVKIALLTIILAEEVRKAKNNWKRNHLEFGRDGVAINGVKLRN